MGDHMDMMSMTALESLKDKKMLYLDISAGALGLFTTYQMSCGNKLNINYLILLVIIFILISRIFVDFVAHIITPESAFGGSNAEFLYSSLVYIIITSIFIKYNDFDKQDTFMIPKLFLNSVVSMMGIARMTRWG